MKSENLIHGMSKIFTGFGNRASLTANPYTQHIRAVATKIANQTALRCNDTMLCQNCKKCCFNNKCLNSARFFTLIASEFHAF